MSEGGRLQGREGVRGKGGMWKEGSVRGRV